MQITAISLQVKNKDRVSIYVDGKYRFSLDVFQLGDLGLKLNKEYSEKELLELEAESQFGKMYSRTLMYTMSRPHSEKEIRDYLWRISQPKLMKSGERSTAIPTEVGERVMDRLQTKGYINDQRFTELWVENRSRTKGASRRKLMNELKVKGVASAIIDQVMSTTERDEQDDLRKVIEKKQSRYDDENKLIAYLMRQGFSYDDVRSALSEKS